METGNCRDGPGADGRGRDGPAKKGECRGYRIEAPPPASDQAPRSSVQAFSYVSEYASDAQTPGSVEQDSRGTRTFRGTVCIEHRANPTLTAFLLRLLFEDGPPPGAAAGGGVREPRRPRLPAASGAAAVERHPEEAALIGG